MENDETLHKELMLHKKIINAYFNYKNSVLIYNMGKVGSSSLVNSIPNSKQIHTLYSDLPPNLTRKKNMSLKRNLVFFLSRLIIRIAILKSKKPIKIITTVRHPIRRNRSMFFQDLELWMTKYFLEEGGDKSSYNLNPLINSYKDKFEHEFYYKWFEVELKRLTKLDIKDASFDNDFSILKNKRFEILIFKLEDFDKNIVNVEKFIGQKITWKSSNISKYKWYSSLYEEFNLLPAFEFEEKLMNNNVVKKMKYDV